MGEFINQELLTMPETILSLNRITKHFGGVMALKDVSFEVQQGEIVGLMGPNGAGKTTLLNIIAGEFPPDSGQIRFKGQDITHHPSYKSSRFGITRTYQIPQPFLTLSVWDHLRVAAIFGKKAGKTAKEINFNKILDMVELLDKRNTLAGDLPILSLKKLELARALAGDPELLLMDEVAAGLTDIEIPKILATIKEIRAMGKTIVLVEHVMKVMVNAVDRIVVLDKGMIICQGCTDNVMNDSKVIEAYFGT
jgi:branched-chain amino acid transport system ATP-binding protein